MQGMPLTEAERAYKSAWRKLNRDKENAYAREYRKKPGVYEKHLHNMRERHARNKDEINAKIREKYATDSEYRLKKRLWNITDRYGVTYEEYMSMTEKQNNLCAVCGEPENNGRRKRLSVDHCHSMGHVRGLLCSNCNTALGLLKEDPIRIKKLLEYLKRHAKVSRRKTEARVSE